MHVEHIKGLQKTSSMESALTWAEGEVTECHGELVVERLAGSTVSLPRDL